LPWLAAAGLVVAIAAAASWNLSHRRPSAAAVTAPTEAPAAPRTDEALAAAERALQSHDYASAQQQAELVLRQAPGDLNARRIADRARTAAAQVDDGIRKARAALASGDFQGASRSAGEVLTLAPNHSEARQIMAEGAARSGRQSAADARLRMAGAREHARAANAPALTPVAYRTATRFEQMAQHLLDTGRTADATARFYEASGLYESAALSAQARAEDKARADAAPPSRPAPPPPSEPVNSSEPAPSPAVVPRAPVSESPPSLPSVPPPTPAPPSQPAPTAAAPDDSAARGASAEEGIQQLLARYKSALESKDLDALKRVWPGLSGAASEAIRTEFQHASRLTVEIIDLRITLSGATGTATFVRRYEVQTRDGQRPRSEAQTTMAVRKTPAGWIIESVRFSPTR
jgi:tetratricopeptide (TPR) repeat protein